MEDLHYDFVELESDESFKRLGEAFGGALINDSLLFDNELVKGNLVKSAPDKGLWIRKWKITTFQKIILHKLPAPEDEEKKFLLIYFLNPAIFSLNSNLKKIKIHGSYNNVFLTSKMMLDLSVMPKQPFYVLDIAFTRSWLLTQCYIADTFLEELLNRHIDKNAEAILTKPCSMEEYKTLYAIEIADNKSSLFIRSRVYSLIFNFFNKTVYGNRSEVAQGNFHYDQIMQVEMIVMKNLKKLPKLETIAKKTNMSVSSLLRQFKLIHGKSLYEYYVAKKMDLAKNMILENNAPVKEIAEELGYKQVSAFIKSFTKHIGCSPGRLKHVWRT